MSVEAGKYIKRIHQSVMIYIVGCCFFFLLAIASIGLGYYLIRYYHEHELPLSWLLFSIAGMILLWEMTKAFRFDSKIPEDWQLATEEDYPSLFCIIHEVTTNLHLSPIHEVYISSDATAAVFIQPSWQNIFAAPQRSLVIGLGFLTQMDDDELRTVLYHEFGHYVQKEMRNTLSVYTIAQFSRSFLAIKEPANPGAFSTQMKSQVLLFTYFAMWVCNRINHDYKQLAKQMEYDADDVAIKYVGASTLQRALLHAACIRYNYDVVQWGMQQLQSQNIRVDNQYLALSFVGNYSRPARRLLSEEVVKRVERLGKLESSNMIASKNVQQSALSLNEYRGKVQQLCPALKFAQWLRQGFVIYTQQRLLETSVELEIHLDKRKHKLPYFDGSYKLLLDDKEIGIGNFIKGYTLKRKTSPGKHKLTAYAPSGIISTPFEFEVEQDKSYHIEMDYKLHAKDGIYDVFGMLINRI